MAQTVETQDHPKLRFREQLSGQLDKLTASLPPHISKEQFHSSAMQAVAKTPELLDADRLSLFEALLQAANDGLLPDGRQGAIVVYYTKVREGKKDEGKEKWIPKCQWLPMVRGIVDKIQNTGQVKSIKWAIVYGGDHFRHWTDDTGDHLEHEAADEAQQNTNLIRNAFAQVILLNGGVYVEVMKPSEIEKIRSKSKSKDSGPWKEWWDQMALKSVFRRLSKRLPMSREVASLFERDDALYDLNLKPAIPNQQQAMPSLTHRLNALVGDMPRDEPREKEPVGRQDDNDGKKQQNNQSASTRKNAPKSNDADSPSDPHTPAQDGEAPDSSDSPSGQESGATSPTSQDAYAAGQQARADGLSRKAVPAAFRKEPLLKDYLEGFDSGPNDNND